MRKIVVFVLFFFSSCGDEDNTKLKNKLFEEPILFSSHNQIITLYSNNPYDIIINYNTPCGYNKLKFEFDLGNVLLITNPSKNSKSGKVKIRLSSQKSGKGIFKIDPSYRFLIIGFSIPLFIFSLILLKIKK